MNTLVKPTELRQIALIGNPNCGKSTLFNRLTGSNQRIGNWPGVTVEQKNGFYRDPITNTKYEVVDLPGCYSLITCIDTAADEKITCDYVLKAHNTLFVNIIDASHLSRDLYLTLQLLELGVPMIVALNCMDLVRTIGLKIDVLALSQALGCKVVPIVGKTGQNISVLQHEIMLSQNKPVAEINTYQTKYPEQLAGILNSKTNAGQILHALEGDITLANLCEDIETINCETDLLIAQYRRTTVHNILHNAVQKQTVKQQITHKIDQIVLHKIFGPLMFIGVMYAMFTTSINLGGILQLVFDQVSEQIFVRNWQQALSIINTPTWLLNILVFGVGKALNITFTFVPVIAAMFFCLGILEGTGYMTRAAFMVDRLMRLFGLPGKAFVPLIVGFGCNVPAVMGTRTLANKRERILTIMMTPFMSCSARLAIYAIFVAAFFPTGGQNVIFSLYLIGILAAVLTALALRSTVLPNEQSSSMLEMPDYRWPSLATLLRQVWHRLKAFILKASGLIIILCILINGIGSTTLETIGKKITPAFAPIGITQDNWPATVGLLTGLVAKEAVIGTLNSVYTADINSSANLENTLSRQAERQMVQRFGGPIAAYAYLLFTLLYFPCVSVVAVIAKELNKKWAVFSVVWSTTLAYLIAALFYQIATWNAFNSSRTLWVISLISILAVLFIGVRRAVNLNAQKQIYKPVPTPLNLAN